MNTLMQEAFPDDLSFAGIELIDVPGFLEFLVRFILNLGVIMILVRWLYFSATKRKEYLFTYILISTVVFLLCFLLETVKLQIGFALGLFAIFGIIRYRTTTMPIKEMTYLFLVIGISVINALTTTNNTFVDLLFANLVLVLITFALERVWLLKNEASKTIIYEKIELIKPENHELLLKDLSDRTGIRKIYRVETGNIDFLKDTCVLTIYYDSASSKTKEMIKQNGNDNDDDD
jgi:hypothetical protein